MRIRKWWVIISYKLDSELLNGSNNFLFSWLRNFWELEIFLIHMISKIIKISFTRKNSYKMDPPVWPFKLQPIQLNLHSIHNKKFDSLCLRFKTLKMNLKQNSEISNTVRRSFSLSRYRRSYWHRCKHFCYQRQVSSVPVRYNRDQAALSGQHSSDSVLVRYS